MLSEVALFGSKPLSERLQEYKADIVGPRLKELGYNGLAMGSALEKIGLHEGKSNTTRGIAIVRSIREYFIRVLELLHQKNINYH